MLSSKEIREYIIEKAVFNGYDTKSVDELLDQVADDMDTLENENTELRMKMKVLVEKIEEYRKIENGLRQSLLTAQTIADDTTAKAKAEADALISRARAEAEQLRTETAAQCEAVVHQYHEQALQAQANMRQAQKECAAFIQQMSHAFREETSRIEAIGARMPVQSAQKSAPMPAASAPTAQPAAAPTAPQTKTETMKGRIERPVEPEIAMTPDQAESGDAEDLTRVFSREELLAAQQGMEQKFTVEVSGSSQS